MLDVFNFKAKLSGATDEDVTVALSTSGTATEGTDYTDGSGSRRYYY